jgi:hypothetical protein
MRRMKLTARCQHMVAASSSSNEDDMSLGVDQEEAPAPTHDAASSSAVSHCRGSVPSQRGQFTYKYEAHWKDNLLM